jgi:hypothetical protein
VAHLVEAREAAGRGLVVHDAHGLDGVRLVLAQVGLDLVRVGADAPVGLDHLGAQAEAVHHLLPQHGELAGLDHQNAVAGRERVGEGSLPGAGAGRRVDDDVAVRLEEGLDAGEDALAELLELRATVIEDLARHGGDDALRDRRGTGNL